MLLVFDLDDTLYPERSFVESGFRAVARFLAPRLGESESALTDEMIRRLDESGRGRIFDDLLSSHGVVDPAVVSSCVDVYRGHEPDIALSPEVEAMLRSLATRGQAVYVVTDGDADVQRRKATTLGLDRLVTDVYPTWAFGLDAAKPSLTCFQMIREREGVEWSDLAYVGDDPSKDFVALNAAGAATVRVHSGRFAETVAQPGYDARLHVAHVTDVPALLDLDLSGPD